MTKVTGDKADPRKMYAPFGEAVAVERELNDWRARSVCRDMKLADLAGIVLTAPGIEHGFLQEVCAVDRFKLIKDGGAKRPEGSRKRREFRCVLWSASEKMADRTASTGREAALECFKAIGVPAPEVLNIQPDAAV